MQANALKLYTLGYSQVKTYGVALLFTGANLLLPQLCHLIPRGGMILLPIYFFTLVAAYKYGWKAGVLIALLSPIANHLLFGMPATVMLPSILVKSSLLALAAGWAAHRFQRVSIPILAGVVLSYQLVGTLFEWAMSGSLYAAMQDFRLGIPGMLLQIVGGWLVIRQLKK